MQENTTSRCYRMDRRQIGFLKFILEGYDNLAVMTTVDARQGVVRITPAPGCENTVDDLLSHLADACGLIALPNGPASSEKGTPKKAGFPTDS